MDHFTNICCFCQVQNLKTSRNTLCSISYATCHIKRLLYLSPNKRKKVIKYILRNFENDFIVFRKFYIVFFILINLQTQNLLFDTETLSYSVVVRLCYFK